MQTLSALLLVLSSLCFAQTNPRTDNATAAVLEAFKTHDIVMLGEIHNNKQEYEWLDALVANSEFADLVDDVVVELGNSLYQKSVDRYISGEAVPSTSRALR
jgi:2-succinyl-5-enolpyruvyl-6-hydroxy-3-cyclohexene-1-carboxylate synthase